MDSHRWVHIKQCPRSISHHSSWLCVCTGAAALPSNTTPCWCAKYPHSMCRSETGKLKYTLQFPSAVNCTFSHDFQRSMSIVTAPRSFRPRSASYGSNSNIASLYRVLCASCYFRWRIPLHWVPSFPVFHGICSDPFPPPCLRCEWCNRSVAVNRIGRREHHHAACRFWSFSNDFQHM